MTNTLRHCATRIVLSLALCTSGAAALAQAAAVDPAYLPFVDASGVVSQDLRRSAVEKALGPPPAAPAPAASPSLRYPHLGLAFTLPAGDAGRDPPVLWMQAHAPSSAQTFGGLRVGLAQSMAVEILERDYRLVSKTVGPERNAPLLAMRVTDREQRTKRELEVQFEGGQVTQLQFVTHAPPKARDATRRTLFQLPTHLVIVALAATATSLVATFIAERAGWRRRWRFPGRLAGPVGLVVLGIGLVALLVSLGWLRDSDPVTRFTGLIGLAFAGGAGLVGLSVMAQSDSRAFSWTAKGGLTLVIIAILLNQTGWFW